ncbi:hypothetical protein JTE90_000792 [Oedothorax gibbosus]|uniref:C2H2-type domain-containing protein n=1 Tax=Oedothorax gibbosus TaxID=931172 RepID=A0AAV6U1X0_9ARAC|nr:hypothetical protein JTE90_000792 [Oedothorax gibbosus]
MESGDSEIRTYLASFHKEMIEDESDSDGGDLYGYLSDNELEDEIQIKEEPEDDPNFYSSISIRDQAKYLNKKPIGLKKSAEIVRLGSKDSMLLNGEEGLSDEDNEDSTLLPSLGEELHIDDQQTLEMVAQFAEQAVSKSSNFTGSLEGGSGSYQTVTIVPSDTNPGELSYVLFVSESPDALLEGDASPFLQGEGGSKAAVRLARSQLVAQQHVCAYCSYTSPKRYLLSRHMKSHSEERPHACGVCGRGFKTAASLQNHVHTHTGVRPHPCRECASCFTTSGELVRHVRYKHTHEKPHKCTECDYASVELSKLKRHMRCHTGERPYHCPHCTYASPDTYKLKRHLRIHTGEKPYACDVCHARFTQSNSLKAHRLIHSGNKPVFQCEYCPTTCGRKTDLRIHMEKLHSSDRPHRCKRCGKVYLDRYSYKIHVKSHEGEKCYKCDLCEYASMSARHLETHMLVHTDQKPFRCDQCDLCFRQKQLLKRHVNLYHDPDYVRPEPRAKEHACHTCGKAFRHKGNLLRHYAVHDPEASVSERESALRLGEPKEPGEDQDGEEEDGEGKDGQQVVVFEVIQLPNSNGTYDGDTFTLSSGDMASLSGDEQGYSIIQSVEDEEENLFNLVDQNRSFDHLEEEVNYSPVHTPSKGRGRGRGKSSVNLKKKTTKSSPKSKRGRRSNSMSSRVVKAEKQSSVQDVLPDNLLGDVIHNDLDECFDFNHKDGLLECTEESTYQTFQAQLEDIS